MSEVSVAELIKALVAASAEFKPIEKDKENSFLAKGKNDGKYATLDSVLKSVEPALLKHGLKIVQAIDIHDSGSPILRTTLYHQSGQSISGNYPLVVDDNPQKFGIAVTYARRYAICSLLCVTADSDTDGEGTKSSSSVTPPAVLPVSAKRQQNMTDIEAELKRLDWSAAAGRAYLQQQFGKSTRKELTDDELNAFLSDLKKIEVAS